MIPAGNAVVAVAVGTGDAQAVAATRGLRLIGWSVRETAGAVATLNVVHGTTTSDPVVGVINLAAAQSDTQWCGPDGIDCPNGIFIDRLTGTTLVHIYYTTLPSR